MNSKTLKLEQEKLREAGYSRWSGPEEVRKRCWELAAIDMIHSLLAYNYPLSMSGKEILDKEKSSSHNYLENYIDALGEESVVRLIDGERNSISDVKTCVYTDSEGVTYNSIMFSDGDVQ